MKLVAGLGFVILSFALNSVMTRYIVARALLDPGLVTAVRFLAGALCLLVVVAASGRLASARPTKASLIPALWLGSYAFLISYGYVHIGAAAGTFVFYALVLATLGAAGIALEGEAPGAMALLGGVLALSGLGLLTLGNIEGTSPLGVAMLAGTGISWGAYSFLGRTRRDPLAFTAANFFLFGLGLTPPTGALLVGVIDTGTITAEGIAIAAFMGAVTTALSYAVWYWCVARITPTQAGIYQLAIPVLTGFMGVVLLDEIASAKLFAAGALVVTGMALSTPRRRAARR